MKDFQCVKLTTPPAVRISPVCASHSLVDRYIFEYEMMSQLGPGLVHIISSLASFPSSIARKHKVWSLYYQQLSGDVAPGV